MSDIGKKDSQDICSRCNGMGSIPWESEGQRFDLVPCPNCNEKWKTENPKPSDLDAALAAWRALSEDARREAVQRLTYWTPSFSGEAGRRAADLLRAAGVTPP